jgi:PAS domain S-box-containing protein
MSELLSNKLDSDKTREELLAELKALRAEVVYLRQNNQDNINTTPSKQAEIALQQQFEQQRFVMEIAQRIRKSLNLKHILDTTVEEVRQFLKTDRVIIFEFNQNWNGTIVVESVAQQWQSILLNQIHDPCFGANYVESFKQGLVTAKSDIYTADINSCHLELLVNFQVRANLVVPILQGDNLWGLLIAHHCAAPRLWQAQEIKLLQQLATQVGIAIQQSTLFKQVQIELMERKRTENILRQREKELSQAKAHLEQRVVKRTSELAAKEKILSDFFNAAANAGIGLGIHDEHKRFLTVNQALADINGVPIAEHFRKTIYDILPPVMASSINSFFDQVITTGQPILNLEMQGETASQPGVKRDWLINFFPTFLADGSVSGLGTLVFEITERKRAENTLYKRQQEFIALVENAPDVIARFDRDLRYLYINSAVEKELGIPAQAFIGTIYREEIKIVQSEINLEAELRETFATGQERCIEYYYQTAQRQKYYQARYVPEFAFDGNVESVLVVTQDITAARSAETALRQQMERERICAGIAQHLRETLDLSEILTTTVTEVQTLVVADRVLVYRIELNGSGKMVAESVAPGCRSLLNKVYSQECCPPEISSLYLQGKIYTLSDRDNDEIQPYTFDFLQKLQVRAKLVVPIIQQSRLWGLLIVHQCSSPREWQPWETNLLQQLANQLAIAIQQSELYQQLQAELRERQIAEINLRQSEHKYKTLTENIPDSIARIGRDLRCLYVNQAIEKHTGIPVEAFIGKTLLETGFPAYFAVDVEGWLQEVFTSGEKIVKEFSFPSPHGLTFNQVLFVPEKSNGGFVKSVLSVTRDITEIKRIEEALRQSEQEFRSLSESCPVGIFRTNAHGECTYTNPRYQDICGCSFEETLGDTWLNFVHPEDRASVVDQWSTAIPELEQTDKEIRFVRKDSSIRYCQVQAAPIFDTQLELLGYVGTLEDITESRAINQMKNEFISIVSHELRTPLTSLRSSLKLLNSGIYDNKPLKSKRMLQVAADSTERLVRLVSDILDLERLESGKVDLIQQSCNAATIMQQSVEAMRDNAEQNNITLCVTDLNVQVWAAPDAIIQTITNLLSNAVKFSEPGTTVSLNAELKGGQLGILEQNSSSSLLPDPYVIFSVKDSGRGIPPDKLEIIFGQFQQVDASDSRQKGGTGLGLAICRSIIRQHGGQIWAESILGEGSTFYFTLPLPPHSQTSI